MSKRFVQNKKIIQSTIGGEVVMMDMDSGFYFGMNGVGSVIWRHLSNEITLDDLISRLMSEFKVNKQTCEADTIEFLDSLLERNIIRVVE
ncbi:MAG: PqqD family peptide modification chaperone [Chitinophagaceae bacterium]|jgi:hypothetical protein